MASVFTETPAPTGKIKKASVPISGDQPPVVALSYVSACIYLSPYGGQATAIYGDTIERGSYKAKVAAAIGMGIGGTYPPFVQGFK